MKMQLKDEIYFGTCSADTRKYKLVKVGDDSWVCIEPAIETVEQHGSNAKYTEDNIRRYTTLSGWWYPDGSIESENPVYPKLKDFQRVVLRNGIVALVSHVTDTSGNLKPYLTYSKEQEYGYSNVFYAGQHTVADPDYAIVAVYEANPIFYRLRHEVKDTERPLWQYEDPAIKEEITRLEAEHAEKTADLAMIAEQLTKLKAK